MKAQREKIFKELYGVETQKEILELFKKDCEEHKKIKNDDEAKEISASKLFSKYVLAITFLYSLSTIKTNLKLYKAIIKELRLGSIVHSKFYFEGLYTTVSKITTTNTETKKEENKKMPFDVIEEIRRVKIILDTKSYTVRKNQNENQVRSYYLAYILGLSTGRRFTEIIKTVTLHKRGNKIYFKGLLKKKDADNNKLVEAHLIELSYKLVNAYIKELRTFIDTKLKETKKKSLGEVSEQQINTIFSRVYNNAVIRITAEKVPNFHELRHFYAITHQDRYLAFNPSVKELNNDSLEAVLKNVRYTVLAHEIKSDTTSAYVTIK